MHSRIAVFMMMAILFLAPAAFGGGKKEDGVSLTFHLETAATDNPKMIFPQMTHGKTRYFQRSPEISGNDVASFVPFPADGGDYGLVIQLKPAGASRLAVITNTNIGRWMIVQLNGRVVDGVMIDKQVDDGRMVIWQGVTLADISLLEKQFPRTGEEGKKK